MNRRQLEKLTFTNIDQYRDKIVDMQSHLGKLWIVCLRMKGRNNVKRLNHYELFSEDDFC